MLRTSALIMDAICQRVMLLVCLGPSAAGRLLLLLLISVCDSFASCPGSYMFGISIAAVWSGRGGAGRQSSWVAILAVVILL